MIDARHLRDFSIAIVYVPFHTNQHVDNLILVSVGAHQTFM
jgi:hypothetical protein